MSDPSAPSTDTAEPVRRPRDKASWPVLILSLLAVGSAIVFARAFLMPVLLAFLLSLTFSPVRRWAQRRGVPPVLTAVAVVTMLIVIWAGMIYALSGPVQTYAQNGQAIITDVERKLRGISNALEKVAEASEEVEKMASGGGGGVPAVEGDAGGREVVDSDGSIDPGTTDAAPPSERVVVDQPNMLTRIVMTAPAIAAQAMFTLVLLFFLTASGDMFYEKLVQASPTFRDKRRAIKIAFDIERKLSRYFLTISIINAGLGIAVGLSLWWLGMPNPLLFGVMAYVLNYIPFLGAIMGVIVCAAIGIVSFDYVGQALFAAGVYLSLTTIEGQFVTPFAVGRSLKLNTVLVFLAVAFWGWAWSVIGMFIAVPVLITLRVFADHIPTLENLAIFLSGHEVPTEDEAPSKITEPLEI
ncbi:MAG: AI-2E family transporter [Celeribacter sp.]|jgi:predicted PurR-regulated permease PerM